MFKKNVKSKPDIIKKRARVLAVFLLLGAIVIYTRLFYLQVVSGRGYKEVAEGQYSFFQKLTPDRGEIKIFDKSDPSGFLVATNLKKPLVYSVPKQVTDPGLVAEKLASVLGMDKNEILPKLTDLERSYVPIKKQLKNEEVDKIKELRLPGIGFDNEYTRFYPENTLLSSVLGFVGYKGSAKMGLYGLERYFENELRGKEGSIRQDKDVGGAWIFGTKREMVPSVDGDTLILTIDRAIQYKAEAVIKNAVETHIADNGSLVVLDPKTGAVLAMANYPSFNPNEYNKVQDPALFRNLATQGAYEPGSVFKAFTMAAALNENKITPETTFTDPGKVVVDNYTIMNSDKKAHGLQTMTQVLEESLNTGVIFAKEKIGNQAFLKYVKAFGFGKATEIELPEAKGSLDNLKENIQVNYHTASFGQGITVTPIQLAAAYGAIANKGVLMKPYIVHTVISSDGKSKKTEPIAETRVITEKTAAEVSGMLVNVVEKGHGKKAGVSGYYIAGKTGTAQVPKQNGKGYEENNNIGSFAGFGPVDDPRFVMVVKVSHPRNVSFAETTAAPAFGEMAEFMLNYYSIPPTRK